jgi:outer membrane lipoprotein carrier protein
MKKILGITILAFSTIQTVSAQNNDAKAKTVLESVSKKINSLKSVKANFALHLSGGNGKVNETKKGTFTMKGQKYHVTIAGQEIFCDTKTIWTYSKDANEVQVNKYDPKEQTISPAKLFTDFYDKEYKYRYIGEKKVAGKNCDVVEMMPLNKDKQLSKIELSVDKATNMVVGGNVWEKNGNKYAYDISGFTPNANVPDNSFTFDPKAHPGVEVVDLR